MIPFVIPNVLIPILTGAIMQTKITDTDNKVTVPVKCLFYWLYELFRWKQITISVGKNLLVSLLEMRLPGNWHESSNLSVSARFH